MKKYLATTIVVLAGLYEVTAQTTTGPAAGIANLGSIISTFNKSVVASLGVLFLAIAVVTFFFGVIRFIWGQQHGDAKAQAVGKSFLVWGLVGIFVAFSVYGIVRFAQTIIPGGNKTTIDKPCVDFVNGCGAAPAGSGGANQFDGSAAGGGASGSSGGAGSGTGAEGDCGSKAIGATCTFNGATGRCADASYGGAKYCNTTTSFDGSGADVGGSSGGSGSASGGSSGGGATTGGSSGADVNGLDDTITCASVGMGGACRENGVDGICIESSDGMRFICQPDSGSDR